MSAQKVAVDLSSANAVKQCGLGELHVDDLGRTWEYVQANGAVAAGEWVLIPNGNDAVKLTTTNAASVGQKVGIAHFAFADNEFGWVFRGNGDFEAIITNAHSAAALLTTTGTDGEAGAGGVALDGARAIDAGVTSTRVTVHCPLLLTVGVAAASD